MYRLLTSSFSVTISQSIYLSIYLLIYLYIWDKTAKKKKQKVNSNHSIWWILVFFFIFPLFVCLFLFSIMNIITLNHKEKVFTITEQLCSKLRKDRIRGCRMKVIEKKKKEGRKERRKGGRKGERIWCWSLQALKTHQLRVC